MNRRRVPFATLTLLALLPIAGPTLAQYDYGGSYGGSYGGVDEGFILILEPMLANPRNTDNVVASSGSNMIIPEWDDELAGRLGFGYQWSGGQTVSLSFWNFQSDVDASGSGFFELPIGPTTGTSYDVNTEICAQTVDAAVSFRQQATERLDVDWSIGMRFASFEEITSGMYGTNSGPVVAAKSNEGEMIGARLGSKLTYRTGSWSIGGGLGFSFLDGELDASASAGASSSVLTDDSRSGSIFDLEVVGAWHSSGDHIRVLLGWEQSIWNDIAADLMRNPPGTSVTLRDRDSVTFSGLKLGLHLRF